MQHSNNSCVLALAAPSNWSINCTDSVEASLAAYRQHDLDDWEAPLQDSALLGLRFFFCYHYDEDTLT
jgi:hypothetical protein